MKKSIEAVIVSSASRVLKTLLFVVFLVGSALLLSLGLWLSLLPTLKVCGQAVLPCALTIGAIAFIALVIPIMLLWWARGYVLFKSLYNLYQLHETPVLTLCAEQICKHRTSVLAVGRLQRGQFSKKLPLPVRLLLKKLPLNELRPALSQTPPPLPESLLPHLKETVKNYDLVAKPGLNWFWGLIVVMLMVRILAGWWL